MTPRHLALARAERRLTERLDVLEELLAEGGAEAWAVHGVEYAQVAQALAALLPALAEHGPLLTTAEAAARLNVAPKTLLRRRKRGEVTAVQLAQRGPGALRWKA